MAHPLVSSLPKLVYNKLTIMKKITLITCFTVSILFFENCARNPVTGKSQVVLMSEAQEIAMGKEADPQIIAQFGLYQDKACRILLLKRGNN